MRRQEEPVSALVTGGAGFIGSHLVEELVRRGANVVVVDDLSSGHPANLHAIESEIEILPIDLRSPELPALFEARSFTNVFHLASHVDVAASVRDMRRDLELNVFLTLALLDAMRDTRSAATLVNVSSGSVYGSMAAHPFVEGEPTNPASPYAVSKLAAEHYVALFARLFELPATSVRLFTVYGPRQRKQVVFDLIQRLVVDGPELEVIGDGTQVRDFNHVANVIDAILLVAERGERGGATYNVAGEEAISIAELVERLCDATGLRPKVAYSGDLRPGDSQRWTADITRLRRLGYRPRVHLEEGLADTVRWFREEIAPGLPGST